MIGGLTFSFALLAGLFLVAMRHDGVYRTLQTWLDSRLVMYLAILAFLLSAAAILLTFTVTLWNPFVLARLRPGFLFVLLLSAGLLPYHILLLKRKPWMDAARWISGQWSALNRWLDRRIFQLSRRLAGTAPVTTIALVIAFPLIFYPAFTHAFPLGDAGLFALMSEQIVQRHFALPAFVPFYGPGGLPFVYPPAGLYLMAFVTGILGIDPFLYMRFAAPFLLWICLIPFTLLAYELTQSYLAAFVAAVILAGDYGLFLLQGTAGGLVRSLAFFFSLLGILFFLRADRRYSWKMAILSGIFLGLSALSHFAYAVFAALFALAFLLTRLFSRKTWGLAAVVGLCTLLVTAPWMIDIIHQHGVSVFLGAFRSHHNDYFLSFIQHPERMIPWFEDSLRPITHVPFLWGFLILGLIYNLVSKKRLTVIWFALVLFFTAENERFLITIGAVMIGRVVADLIQGLSQIHPRPIEPGPVTKRGMLFFLMIVILFYWQGWNALSDGFQPYVDAQTIDLARHVREDLPNDSTYLVVTDDGEAEWFPYLLRRTPVAATWGGEWLGTYNQNLEFLIEIQRCGEQQSFQCLLEVIYQVPVKPDFIITHAQSGELNQQLASQQEWHKAYANDRFVVWNSARK